MAWWASPFWLTFGLGLYGIRVVADYWRKRLYLKNNRSRRRSRLHLHHFLFGFPLTFVAWFAFQMDANFTAELLAGFATALWASESKELILQEWGP